MNNVVVIQMNGLKTTIVVKAPIPCPKRYELSNDVLIIIKKKILEFTRSTLV